MTSTSTDGLPPATDESALYDAPSHRRDDHPHTAIVDNVAEAVPPAVGQPDVRGWVAGTTVPW